MKKETKEGGGKKKLTGQEETGEAKACQYIRRNILTTKKHFRRGTGEFSWRRGT